MKTIDSDIIIIGGGLTGLTLAYLLRMCDLKILVLEGRSRLGGRIYTRYEKQMPPVDLGATWLGQQHTQALNLIKELGIETFAQELGQTAIYEPISTSPPQFVRLPPNDQPSFRVKDGTSRIINVLSKHLKEERIFLNHRVNSIDIKQPKVKVKTNNAIFSTQVVISTLPPQLFIKTISVSPQLPQKLTSIARNTHTWMGDSIKIALTYAQPFWKKKGSSGTIFSNVGPIPEMYDHSNAQGTFFALKGFLNGVYFKLTQQERLAMALDQLEKYYGAQVRNYQDYSEHVWQNDRLTSAQPHEHVLPHQNNGHEVYQESYGKGHLYFAGTETSKSFPGYMEGAVRSARSVFDILTQSFDLPHQEF